MDAEIRHARAEHSHDFVQGEKRLAAEYRKTLEHRVNRDGSGGAGAVYSCALGVQRV